MGEVRKWLLEQGIEWETGHSQAFLVRMQINITIMENSTKVPQNAKNRAGKWLRGRQCASHERV